MKAKKITFFMFFLSMMAFCSAQNADIQPVKGQVEQRVMIETDMGNIIVKLYNETPKHRDNFIKLVKNGDYDSLLFHRVINFFMIQGGDPKSKYSQPGQPLGEGSLGYTIPAEFVPGIIHKKGALAAARMGDEVNPRKESSSIQFYIVQGNVWTKEKLQAMAQYMGKELTEQQIETYTTIGGTPHLDGDYTVFGEVVEGLEVVDKIAAVPVDGMARPLENIKMRMYILNQE